MTIHHHLISHLISHSMRKRALALLIVLAMTIMLAAGVAADAPDREDNKPTGAADTLESEPSEGNRNFHKNETVYGVMDQDGGLIRVEIVNHLSGDEGDWIDYGVYADLQNLTDDRQPVIDQDQLIWPGDPQQDLYYQGTFDGPLPWQVAIEWRLDGTLISAQELAGQSGDVDLRIAITADPSAAAIYRSHYALQLAVSLDMERAREVESPGASAMIAGKTRTLAYNILPGQNTRVDIHFTASDFSMDPIQITALLAGEQDGFDQLLDGVSQIRTGQEEAADGSDALADGLNDWINGFVQLSGGLDQLTTANRALLDGMDALRTGLNGSRSGMEELAGGSNRFADGLNTYAVQGSSLYPGYQELADQLALMRLDEQSKAELQQLLALPDLLPDGQSTLAAKELAYSLLALDEGIAAISGALTQANQGLKSYTDTAAILSAQYASIDQGIQQLPDANAQLLAGFNPLRQGLVSATDGLTDLQGGLNSLLDQGGALPQAAAELASGQEELATALAVLEQSVSSLLPQDTVYPQSFAAAGKIRPDSVQFLLRTPGIVRISETDTLTPDHSQSTKTSFWQRLGNLF